MCFTLQMKAGFVGINDTVGKKQVIIGPIVQKTELGKWSKWKLNTAPTRSKRKFMAIFYLPRFCCKWCHFACWANVVGSMTTYFIVYINHLTDFVHLLTPTQFVVDRKEGACFESRKFVFFSQLFICPSMGAFRMFVRFERSCQPKLND